MSEALGTQDRWVILAALLGVTVIAWLYLVLMPGTMAGMEECIDMPGMLMEVPWTPTAFALTFAMWWVMMVGMMLPSAAPMILTFATLNRSNRARGQDFVPTAIFAAGYLIAWGGFSVLATLGQWALDRLALLSPMMRMSTTLLGATVVILAGLYQFTPWKYTCLHHCRTPFAFILHHWRDGRGGALRMGLEHGAYCLGCCAPLMALLFVVGVMNLLWVAGLAVFVFGEKLLPGGVWLSRVGGVTMVVGGVAMVVWG